MIWFVVILLRSTSSGSSLCVSCGFPKKLKTRAQSERKRSLTVSQDRSSPSLVWRDQPIFRNFWVANISQQRLSYAKEKEYVAVWSTRTTNGGLSNTPLTLNLKLAYSVCLFFQSCLFPVKNFKFELQKNHTLQTTTDTMMSCQMIDHKIGGLGITWHLWTQQENLLKVKVRC